MNRKLIALTVVAAFILIPVAIKFSGSKPKHELEQARVENKEIHPAILASGNLVFRQEVNLSSEVIGKVSEVLVKEGDKVEQGQVLLRLDPTVIRAEVAQQQANQRSAQIAIERAQLNVENQQRNLERSRRLAQDKFINTSKLDDDNHLLDLAKVELRSSRETLLQVTASLSQSNERLAKTEVRSPITGTVTVVPIKIGETAVASATGMAGSSLMTIADVSSLMAEISVDEADIARVAQGQRAKIFPSAFPDQPIMGTVERVSLTPKVAAPGASQGRSYVVRLVLDPHTAALRTGMTCRVEIVTSSGSAKPAVPIGALLTEDQPNGKDGIKTTTYIYAIENGVVKKKTVELGLSDDSDQEITKGVKLGDMVAVGPARTLHEIHDGEAVSIAKSAPTPATTPVSNATRATPAKAGASK